MVQLHLPDAGCVLAQSCGLAVQLSNKVRALDKKPCAFDKCCSALGELSFNRLAGGGGILGVTGSGCEAQALKLIPITSNSGSHGLLALCVAGVHPANHL
jgi:hypothetical protein